MNTRREGMTLIEACTVVCVVGVLLAAFLPTFFRNVRTSKIEEASAELERLHQATAAYFAADHVVDGHHHRHCLPEAAGPAPAQTSERAIDVDFRDATTPGVATWTALGFQPDRPIRYRYTLLPARTGCDLTAAPRTALVTFRAEGDLDGDTARSTFERRAGVDAQGNLVPVDILFVHNRVE